MHNTCLMIYSKIICFLNRKEKDFGNWKFFNLSSILQSSVLDFHHGKDVLLLRLVNSLRIFYRWRNQNKKKAYYLLQRGEEFDIWPILPKLDMGFKTISK